MRGVLRQQRVRNLDGEAGAVTGCRVRRNGTPMRETDERPYCQLDYPVARLAIDTGNEPRAAAVVLESWVIEWWWIALARHPSRPVRADR